MPFIAVLDVSVKSPRGPISTLPSVITLASIDERRRVEEHPGPVRGTGRPRRRRRGRSCRRPVRRRRNPGRTPAAPTTLSTTPSRQIPRNRYIAALPPLAGGCSIQGTERGLDHCAALRRRGRSTQPSSSSLGPQGLAPSSSAAETSFCRQRRRRLSRAGGCGRGRRPGMCGAPRSVNRRGQRSVRVAGCGERAGQASALGLARAGVPVGVELAERAARKALLSLGVGEVSRTARRRPAFCRHVERSHAARGVR